MEVVGEVVFLAFTEAAWVPESEFGESIVKKVRFIRGRVWVMMVRLALCLCGRHWGRGTVELEVSLRECSNWSLKATHHDI